MEDDELPSESTARPTFRRNVKRNVNIVNSSSSIDPPSTASQKKLKRTARTTTKRRPTKSIKPSSTRGRQAVIHSTPKKRTSPRTFDDLTSSEDDMCESNDQASVQQLNSNQSLTPENDNHTQGDAVNLNKSFASSDTVGPEEEQAKTIPKTTTQSKEAVLKHFTKQDSGQFKCNLCINSSKLFPPANALSDTNLRSHLGRAHQLTSFLYPSQKKKEKTFQPPEVTPGLKKVLDAAAIQAIVQDSHAFNLFRKPGMKKFLSLIVPGYRGPNRRIVTKRLKSQYKERRSTIRNELSTVSDIALSADLWQSVRRDHFLCLSVHYYDDNYVPHSRIISFRQFIGSHSGARIERFITNELEKLYIQNKIRSLTSDNGSDIKSASKRKCKFGIRISCLLHMINLAIKNGLWLFEMPKKPNHTVSSVTSNSITTITTTCISNPTDSTATSIGYSDGPTEDDEHDMTVNYDLVSDGNSSSSDSSNLDDSNDSSDTSSSTISSSDDEPDIASAGFDRNSVDSNDRPSLAITEEELFLEEALLDPSVLLTKILFLLQRVRNSIINTLTLDSSKEKILKPKQRRALTRLAFTSLDWSILKALENTLAPFSHSTKILSSRQRPTLSICHSIIHALKGFLTISEDAPLTLDSLIKRQLLHVLNFYLDNHVSDDQTRAALVSAFLDPSTYTFLTCEDKKEAEAIIINEAKAHYTKLNSKSLPNSSSSTASASKNDRDNDSNVLQSLFVQCGLPIKSATIVLKPSTTKEEIARYVASRSNYQSFSQYWNDNRSRLPVLSSIVRQFNIMCPTSIDCESAFSIAGYLQRKHRSSLAPSTLRYSMLLRD